MKRMMKAGYALALCTAISACGFFFFNPNFPHAQLPRMKGLMNAFPNTPAKVHAYADETIALFDAEAEKFLSVGANERNFTNTVKHWNHIGKMLINRMIILKSLSITNASEETLQAAEAAFERIQEYFRSKLTTSPQIPLAIINYLENASETQNLSPSEWLYVYQLADSLNSSWFPLFYQRKIDAMKETISAIPRLNYSYRKGEASVKALTKEKSSFSLLNFNVCFLPGSLPLLFGGMTPWELRIDKVAERIQQLDADVVCLQEVFEEEAAELLYEKLKGRYAHFYINIGPRNFGFSQESAGMSSGLFIASKLEIENPKFHLFKNTTYHMNRGYFEFGIPKDGAEFAHIYTTHLEAFAHPPGPEFREEQLQEILHSMQEKNKRSGGKTAFVLCGDLNIPWSSDEPAELMLKEYFSDSCRKMRKEISMKNRTYVDYTDLWWKARLDTRRFQPKPEILDYAMLLNKVPGNDPYIAGKNFSIITAVIPMNEIEKPLDALSDHHAEISLIQHKENLK